MRLLAMLSTALIAPLLSALLFASEPAADAQPAFQPNAYHAGPAAFTLPFHLVNGHIFIDGAVDGRRGKFMFDTGTEFAFFLNNHFLPLRKQALVARGHAGSGQEMVLYRQRKPLAGVEIGKALRFDKLEGFLHTDWSFLEEAYGIPAFLGSIGHGLNRNYAFVIDYDLQTIEFHPFDANGTAPTLAVDPERVVARLAFTTTGVDGKMPELAMRLGGYPVTAFFDTGNPGSLELTRSTQAALQHKGLLQLTDMDHVYGSYQAFRRADVSGLRHAETALVDLRNLSFTEAKADRIGLGYQFLKHYISVWDYQGRTLTLLRR
ncbi:MAG TPA: hypothetical protein VN259_16450 [Xanthomonadales bacterium]|nr:hypothetical protein [Xanthomonadales bacterium]